MKDFLHLIKSESIVIHMYASLQTETEQLYFCVVYIAVHEKTIQARASHKSHLQMTDI